MKKLLVVLVILLTISFTFGTINFWTAPNPQQEEFWKGMVEEWNANNPDAQIKWKVIPATGSSEEAILTAIASGEGPDLCTNIFSGFAAQLIEAGVLVPWNDFDGYEELLEKRGMVEAIKGWEFGGNSYVIPIYSNPMLVWWRSDILEEAGFDNPPRTYSEVLALGEKVAIPKERYAYAFIKGKNWWDRWYDFITHYYAAGDGAPYFDVQNNKCLFNKEEGSSGEAIGYEVANFIEELFDKDYDAISMIDNALYLGAVVGQINGPWDMPTAASVFPEVYPEHIVFSTPPVPDSYPADKPVKTFADTKGMVLFNFAEDKDKIWEFVKWVYSDPEHDKKWLELTNLPPVRDDLTTNELFAPIFENNTGLKAYAEYVPYAVPPALTTFTTEIQDLMTQYLIEPLSLQKETAKDAVDRTVNEINKELF